MNPNIIATINDDFHIKVKNVNILFQFIKSNQESQFMKYISTLSQENLDVNMKDDQGNYLIHFAIMINSKDIVKKLIEYGSRLDILDTDGYTIFYYPIKLNYIEILKILIEYNKKIIGISLVNIRDSRGSVPIFYAIKYKNIHALQLLLKNGADPNYKNNENVTALHMAVLKKDVNIVKTLLEHTKNIDAITKNGSTPLHLACNFQLVEIATVLLEKGANPNINEMEYDFYPIFYAVIQNNFELTKMLIDYKTNPNHQDYLGNTFIHYAIINNHIKILDYVMEKYDINTKSIDIYFENINNKEDIERTYIDPNLSNIDGVTITHLMLYNYKEDFDKYLIRVIPFSNINYQDNTGNTVLHIIAEKKLFNKFEKILLSKKLNIYIQNNQNKSVLDLIPTEERNSFAKLVVKSYYNYLKKYELEWLLEWQNKCSGKDLTKLDKNKCYQYIYNSIFKERISIPIKKNKININVILEEPVYFSTFTGTLLDLIVGFKYLTKKYKHVTSFFHFNQEYDENMKIYNQSIGIQENLNQHIINFEIRWIYQRMFFPPEFESILSDIIRSGKYKYFVIPIGIILSNGNHSNGLLYDIENKVMERFEPHGSEYPYRFNYNPNLLDEILYKKFVFILSNIYGKPIQVKYYTPKHYLPKIGFQTLENLEITINKNIGDPNGFCTLWIIWYLDYRLKYIHMKPDKLAKKLIDEIKSKKYSFRTLIRNYSKNVTNLRDTYLSRINKNINDYINNRMNKDDLKKLLFEILTD